VLYHALQLEYSREREAVDAIMRRIVAEDALDAHARAAKRAETQAYIAAFLAQQQSIRCPAGAMGAPPKLPSNTTPAAQQHQIRTCAHLEGGTSFDTNDASGREQAAAEAARQEKAIEEYAAAKREQEGQHEARRAANREVADRYGLAGVYRPAACHAPYSPTHHVDVFVG
jgi:hypothetical protein